MIDGPYGCYFSIVYAKQIAVGTVYWKILLAHWEFWDMKQN